MRDCRKVQQFVDGRLDAEEADRFRDHLGGCARCQSQLHDLVQLGLLADQLASDTSAPRLRLAEDRARPPRRRWIVLGAVAALAAGVALLVSTWRRWRPVDGDAALLELAAASPTRTVEARLARHEADRFRPYSPSLSAPVLPAMPLGAMARLEEKGDVVGVATAFLLAGDFERAGVLLDRAPRSADVDSDRAVVERARGRLEEGLALDDAVLAAQPNHPQALWNRGLLLRDLGLTALAAESFEGVAKLGEPGWSVEAAARAAELERDVRARRDGWLRANAAGKALVRSGEPISDEQVAAYPGVLRLFFYHAVRAAPSSARVRELLATAIALDRAAGGGDTLRHYVERIADSDFKARAPLAAAYLDLYENPTHFDAAARRAYLDRLRRAKAEDLLQGTLALTDSLPADSAEYRRLATASGDPWFSAIADEEEAKAEIARGDLLEAERHLLVAIPVCRARGIDYRCSYLVRTLAELYSTMYRFSEARQQAVAGWELARRSHEWGFEAIFLQDLAWASADHRSAAMTRAYLDETSSRHLESCEVERYVRLRLARLAIDELHPEEARAQLSRAPLCNQTLPLGGVEALAVLAHWNGTSAERDQARGALESLRAGELRPGERAIADELEGRLLIERDPAAGRALLTAAIDAARARPAWDSDAEEARSFAYAALLADAGGRGAWEDALALFGREVGVVPPSRCALGVAADYDRVTVAARGADGALVGAHQLHWSGALNVADLVSDEVKAALAACPSVDVFARPPFQGHADLLPRELAWRERVGRPAAAASTSPTEKRLVVTGVEPPPSLGLPRLRPWDGGDRGAPLVLLEGAAATPQRVIAEMQSATEIEFHTHGLVDLGVSDVSLLVLSPGADGHYALSAGDVRRQHLAGAPLVVLGACSAATASPYRQRPWSLPVAFIEAGARAVLASPAPLSDGEVAPFFDAVRARIRAGAPAAVALRDTRCEWAARDPYGTVQQILLFE